MVGYTGPIDREELDALEVDGYLRDDVIGKAGVEASFEDVLRGTYGAQLVERDASGRQLKVIETIREPIAGTNLMLTIDADVQRLATKALTWGMEVADVSQGVTVVMNPQTGEILAMVSLPAYDNNKFAGGISADDYGVYLTDEDRPLRNHAISDIYPPGSTYKLVTGIAAMEEGVTTADRLWPTYGCYQIPGAPKGECLYDWNRQGFGPLAMVDAFAKSSDTFFYQMAVETGIDPLAQWANELGFGRLSGIRLPSEEEGIIASTEWARQQGRSGVFTGEVAQAGIGQNVIAVTPLQMLNAYAAVANGGSLMRPMIVRGETDASGELVKAYEPEVLHEIAADDAHAAHDADRRAGGHHVRPRLQHPRPEASRRPVGEDRHRRVRRAHRRGHASLPLVVRGLPAERPGRDGRGPGDRQLQLLGDRPRKRVGRGREVLPPDVLRPGPGSAARSE